MARRGMFGSGTGATSSKLRGVWHKLAPNTARVRTDVFAVFVNPGKGGLMNLDWVEFKEPGRPVP